MGTPGTSGNKRNSCATHLQHSKRSRICLSTLNPNSNRVIESWLADEDSSGSEVDDVGEDFCPEHSEHDTDTSTDISDTEETQPEQLDAPSSSSDDDVPLSRLGYFRGKNKYKWSKLPPNRSSVRTPQHNIISRVPTSNLTQNDGKDPYSLWKQYINDEMLSEILLRTNEKLAEYRSKYMKQDRPELKDIDIIELQAFIGLLMYTAVFKSNHEDADLIFATDGTGRDIFRCVMSKNRFLCLLHCLRFDNALDRAQRKETNRLAAISNIFNKFVSNCQKLYNIRQYATVDEMLVPFRGRSFLMIYMPKKPGKYGLKLMCLCDAENGYFYNCYVYCGKGSDGETLTDEERKLLVPTQAVIRLSKPLHGSNKNITCDNWFTSIQLIDALRQRGLTCVGTVKKNKREIPPEFLPAKTRPEKSTLYGFTKDTTLLSHVPKKGKAVILASSMHHNEGTNTDSGKPKIIQFYNSTKGGVDEIDKKCSVYTCSRRSRRWPRTIFYLVLDISSVNSHLLHDIHVGKQTDRGDFIKKLARQLVLEHIKRRFSNLRLPRELRMSLARVLGSDKPETCEDGAEEVKTRKTCLSCQPKLKRKSTYKCYSCKKHVCLQCAKQVCPDCA
ncbi:piggyBac transposable element-derived protein 4 isoform X1 [Agrilus planipennis]|uniref:PiggyBac transposable element-derived protein 4 isoform X1 n=1 Tax=Agrilus planipennis TaxID=224129 RepID=A0A7F5RIN8_AGRPL|nr:piggyBac transposable element-derived protein 4 isoform X1 [Agrilus planipennis]XP_025835841.1 piggyBac transposable element-derived protein 4 isoform X1 [Agrilus planipennis]